MFINRMGLSDREYREKRGVLYNNVAVDPFAKRYKPVGQSGIIYFPGSI